MGRGESSEVASAGVLYGPRRAREAKERAFLEGGIRKYYFGPNLHRDGGPAWIEPNGTKRYYEHGKLHRVGAPAIVGPDGREEWYENDLCHRVGGPAVVIPGDRSEWHHHGVLHREDGAAIEWAGGTQMFYRHGKPHNEDGPAIVWTNGKKEWWVDGKRHRLDGPAIERPGGAGNDFYIDDVRVEASDERLTVTPEAPGTVDRVALAERYVACEMTHPEIFRGLRDVYPETADALEISQEATLTEAQCVAFAKLLDGCLAQAAKDAGQQADDEA